MKAERSGAAGPLFLAPLRVEAFAVRRGAHGSSIERMGMGPVRATATRVRLEAAAERRRPIVLIGFGGALGRELRPGHVVVASSVVSMPLADNAAGVSQAPALVPRPPDAVPLPVLPDIVALLRGAGLVVHEGPIVSAPAIVRDDAERKRAAASGAIAVDMESYWCAPLASARPFAVVRVIVDVPGHDVRSPATLGAGLRAYRSLVTAARALGSWSPVSLKDNPLQEVGDL